MPYRYALGWQMKVSFSIPESGVVSPLFPHLRYAHSRLDEVRFRYGSELIRVKTEVLTTESD